MNPARRRDERVHRNRLRGAWLSLLLAVVVPAPVVAAPFDLLVVTTEDSGPQAEVVAELRKALTGGPGPTPTLQVISAADYARAGTPSKSDLIVTVGTEAAGTVLATRPSLPVYCGFLPQSSYASLLAPVPRERRSALYVDQPLERQLRLIREALPRHNRVGTVLGPDSRRLQSALQRAAAGTGLQLNMEVIDRENQLVRALYRALENSDILFVVPDAVVFNRHTAQNVLTTVFRIGKPVAGYSRAYVNAGALLAVYSTPAQIGRQMGEVLRKTAMDPGHHLPPPAYPGYFTVVTNERLARSYGLELELAEQLTRKLVAAEEAR